MPPLEARLPPVASGNTWRRLIRNKWQRNTFSSLGVKEFVAKSAAEVPGPNKAPQGGCLRVATPHRGQKLGANHSPSETRKRQARSLQKPARRMISRRRRGSNLHNSSGRATEAVSTTQTVSRKSRTGKRRRRNLGPASWRGQSRPQTSQTTGWSSARFCGRGLKFFKKSSTRSTARASTTKGRQSNWPDRGVGRQRRQKKVSR